MTESVGIDFGPTSDLSPANWNSSAGNAGSNFLLSDLVDESGAPTPIDLLVEFNDGLDALLGSPGPDASLLRSAHLENTFREYVSAGHSVFLQGSGLLPATLTLIFFIFRHVE